jgi:hypothetical protein
MAKYQTKACEGRVGKSLMRITTFTTSTLMHQVTRPQAACDRICLGNLMVNELRSSIACQWDGQNCEYQLRLTSVNPVNAAVHSLRLAVAATAII